MTSYKDLQIKIYIDCNGARYIKGTRTSYNGGFVVGDVKDALVADSYSGDAIPFPEFYKTVYPMYTPLMQYIIMKALAEKLYALNGVRDAESLLVFPSKDMDDGHYEFLDKDDFSWSGCGHACEYHYPIMPSDGDVRNETRKKEYGVMTVAMVDAYAKGTTPSAVTSAMIWDSVKDRYATTPVPTESGYQVKNGEGQVLVDVSGTVGVYSPEDDNAKNSVVSKEEANRILGAYITNGGDATGFTITSTNEWYVLTAEDKDDSDKDIIALTPDGHRSLRAFGDGNIINVYASSNYRLFLTKEDAVKAQERRGDGYVYKWSEVKDNYTFGALTEAELFKRSEDYYDVKPHTKETDLPEGTYVLAKASGDNLDGFVYVGEKDDTEKESSTDSIWVDDDYYVFTASQVKALLAKDINGREAISTDDPRFKKYLEGVSERHREHIKQEIADQQILYMVFDDDGDIVYIDGDGDINYIHTPDNVRAFLNPVMSKSKAEGLAKCRSNFSVVPITDSQVTSFFTEAQLKALVTLYRMES